MAIIVMYINVPRKVVLAIIVIRENCKDINVPGKVVLAIIVIRENCKVHTVNVPGKDHMVQLVMQHVIRENCT